MAESGAAAPLYGVGVLVTRPVHQATGLIRLLEQAGANPLAFPTIEIAAPTDPAALHALLARLEDFDMAIFVSANAVERTFAALHQRGLSWPARLAVACIGPASAGALTAAGVTGAIVSRPPYDTEALLADPALVAVAGKHLVIFRGHGGRELLGDTLTRRGAAVVYAECYRRRRPHADVTPVATAWRQNRLHIVSVTSTEGLDNLYAMLGEAHRARLLRTPIVVLSEAQARRCRALGFAHEALRAPAASDEAILNTIKTWRLGCFSL